MVRFVSFELDPQAGELRKDGIKVRLQEQPLQILKILVKEPGKVITREDLRNRIWPSDTFVDFDHGINNAIKRMREALGDTAETPRYVETLPRRGYRFIGKIECEAPRMRSRSEAKDTGRRVIFDSTYDVFQPNFSPDGRWIAFQAVKNLPTKLESTPYIAPISGGPSVAIIYFISGRSGFFNVSGIHFDPSRAKVVGRPFAVTNFSSPAYRMPEHEPSVDLSVTKKDLLLTLEQDSGSI